MRYNNGPHSAASMVASYGVYNNSNYSDNNYRDNNYRSGYDEDGFIPRAAACRGVIVNASGDSSVVRSPVLPQSSPGNMNGSSRCGWCLSSQSSTPSPSNRNSCLISWCRPTILLLILVLLVVVFVLVSGILLYHNCDDRLNCQICAKLTDCYKKTSIAEAPVNLIITLIIFKHDSTSDVSTKLLRRFEKDEHLTLADHYYNLHAVIVHCSSGVESGHYYALVKDEMYWFEFDNSRVTKYSGDEVLNLLEPLETLYILFHEREDISRSRSPDDVVLQVFPGFPAAEKANAPLESMKSPLRINVVRNKIMEWHRKELEALEIERWKQIAESTSRKMSGNQVVLPKTIEIFVSRQATGTSISDDDNENCRNDGIDVI